MGEREVQELPLRFDTIFEGYMKLAALLLDAPPLDFTESSYSLREFAKMMQKSGFISLSAGLMVTKIHHSNIDDVYPDATVFGGAISDVQDEDILDGILDATDLAWMGEREELTSDMNSSPVDLGTRGDYHQHCRGDCSRDALAGSVQENKAKQMVKITLLRALVNRQEAKQAWIHEKMQKKARKMVEKELRKTNMKCNAEHTRGGKDRGDKYHALTAADADALAFHYKRAQKRSNAVKTMLALKVKNGRLQQLRDLDHPCHSAVMKMLDWSVQSSADCTEDAFASAPDGIAFRDAPFADFERPDHEFFRTPDSRGAQKVCNKARHSKAPADDAPASVRSRNAAGANFKVARELRELLVQFGFSGSRDLAELPEFVDLRSAYKRALLVLHPDKVKDSSHAGCTGATMDFLQLQGRYRDLLTRYYDVDAQDFSAEVKAHRKSQLRQRAKKAGSQGL